MSTAVLVDGMNMVYRCGYTYRNLSTRDSQRPTGATYGSILQILGLWKHIKDRPLHVIVFWEGSAPKGSDTKAIPSWRKSIYPKYKGQRKSDPDMDDARAQVPVIMEGIRRLRIPQVYVAGLEADDLIGIAASELGRGASVDEVIVFSTDKDMYQLVNHNTRVLRMLRGKAEFISGKQVVSELGIAPASVPLFKALCGDLSDNYRSIAGIGPKTAARMLSDGINPSFPAFSDHSRNVRSKYKDHVISHEWSKVHLCYKIAKIPTGFDGERLLPIPKSMLRDAEKSIRLALSASLSKEPFNKATAIARWTQWCGEYELYSLLADRRQVFDRITQ